MTHTEAIKTKFKAKLIVFIAITPKLNQRKHPEIKAPRTKQLSPSGPSTFKLLKGLITSNISRAPNIKNKIEIVDNK